MLRADTGKPPQTPRPVLTGLPHCRITWQHARVHTSRLVVVAAALLALAACATTHATGHPTPVPSPTTTESATADPMASASTPSADPSASPSRRSTAGVLPGATRPGTIPPVIDNGLRIGNRVALTFDADMTDAMRNRLAADPSISFANRKVIDILDQTRNFRFPGLCYDDIALKALAPLGVTVIHGDVVSGDPYATAAAPIIHAVLTRVQPGSIVIMHITEANAQYTDEALSAILSGLRARGLRPVALSELFR